MANLIYIAIGVAIAAVRQLPPLFRQKHYADIAAYLVLMLTGAYFSWCCLNLVRLPSPVLWLGIVFKPLVRLFIQ
ncbi:hypothetical protein [Cohnella boryungensis]|uniref:Uncharacterized protein n=1 Tax=Cohnella boryungensis TaxID=768479 RepID=A0ABV8SF40_9BACL